MDEYVVAALLAGTGCDGRRHHLDSANAPQILAATSTPASPADRRVTARLVQLFAGSPPDSSTSPRSSPR
jgi:hypothetical protein